MKDTDKKNIDYQTLTNFNIEDDNLAFEVKRFNEIYNDQDMNIALSRGVNAYDMEDLKIQVEQNKIDILWEQLADIVEDIQYTDYKKAEAYINLFCKEEKKEIAELFKKEFSKVPNNSKLKNETLNFLGLLGIKVFL